MKFGRIVLCGHDVNSRRKVLPSVECICSSISCNCIACLSTVIRITIKTFVLRTVVDC